MYYIHQGMEDNNISKQYSVEPNPSNVKLSWFYRIVCWCSGASLYLLEKCPADYNKFQYEILSDIEKSYIKKIYEAKSELDKIMIEKWKEKELQKIKENIDKYIEPIEKLTNRDNKIYI